jgi:hypothetical protein
MHKIVVTKSGKTCYIGGEGARGITITAFDTVTGKIDEVVEEFEIMGTPDEIEKLRKVNTLQEFRKKKIKALYERGKNKKEDDLRDTNAKVAIRLPDERRKVKPLSS